MTDTPPYEDHAPSNKTTPAANQNRDAVRQHTLANQEHEERMKTDPAYAARHNANMKEQERQDTMQEIINENNNPTREILTLPKKNQAVTVAIQQLNEKETNEHMKDMEENGFGKKAMEQVKQAMTEGYITNEHQQRKLPKQVSTQKLPKRKKRTLYIPKKKNRDREYGF